MTITLLTVTYRLSITPSEFLARMDSPARAIASTPGLIFKLWGLDPDTGLGTSSYLFADRETANTFASGPMIDALRNGPATDVSVHSAPIDADLSRFTHAGFVLDAANHSHQAAAN